MNCILVHVKAQVFERTFSISRDLNCVSLSKHLRALVMSERLLDDFEHFLIALVAAVGIYDDSGVSKRQCRSCGFIQNI